MGVPKVSFRAPSAPGGKHFRKIDSGIWDPTLNHEKMKVAPRNSEQNPGLKIFRALLCVGKRAFPFTVIHVFFDVLSPGDAAGGRILGIGLGTLHAWAEIRSSPKIPLLTFMDIQMTCEPVFQHASPCDDVALPFWEQQIAGNREWCVCLSGSSDKQCCPQMSGTSLTAQRPSKDAASKCRRHPLRLERGPPR